jgi:tetratricopeptide (TPR) repeat protein
MTRLRTCLVLIVLALAPALPTRRGALAQSGSAGDEASAVAEQHFELGERLFALGRFAAALVEYEKAFEAAALPHFLFNIGQCHRNMGDYDAAIFSFRTYLKLWPGAPNRPAVERLLALLEEKRAAALRAAQRKRDSELVGAPPPSRARRGIHTRWWFWTGVAAAAGGTAIYLSTRDRGPALPESDLGNVDFGR